MPGGPLNTDGIVIDYRYFGVQDSTATPYNEGKTLTHLIGNYLNLYDIWGESPCEDDYVDDTPIHNSPNSGLDPNTGSGSMAYQHVSTCPGEAVEMVMNFMDNTRDNMLYMFTKDQRQRMHACLAENGPRGSLSTTATECDNNLQASEIDFRAKLAENPPSDKMRLNLFPNPASDKVYVQLSDASLRTAHTQVEVYTTSGQLMYQSAFQALANGMHSIDTQTWLPATYVLYVKNGKQEWSKRLMVNK